MVGDDNILDPGDGVGLLMGANTPLGTNTCWVTLTGGTPCCGPRSRGYREGSNVSLFGCLSGGSQSPDGVTLWSSLRGASPT